MFNETQMTEILHHLLDMPAETEIVEFKRAEKSFSDSDLGQYFSALSNEANLKGVEQAWLVFGVDSRTHALTNSQYRNSRPALDEMKKKIADVFFRAGFIEAWGRGIGIVYDEMSAKGLKMPVWKSICGGIEVTVGREVYRNLNSEIGTTGPEVGAIPLKIGTILTETGTRDWRIEINAIKNLQKRQVELMLQLMEIVSADNKLSYSDLAKLTGKSRSTIQLYMLYLSDHGFIRRVGDKYSGHWEVR